jgi:hypothetical protein
MDPPTISEPDADPSKMKVPELDLAQIPVDTIIYLIGRRGSGKSVLLRELMWYMRRKIDIGIGMNPSEHASHTMRDICHPACVFTEYDGVRVGDIVEMQRQMKEAEDTDGKPHARRVALLLDDCMADKSIMSSKEIKVIHKLGRHYDMTLVNCMQYAKDAPPQCSGQADFVFMWNEPAPENIKMLYSRYCGGLFHSENEFIQVFKQITRSNETEAKHDCLVFDMNRKLASSSDGGGGVYFYRSRLDIPKYVLGSPRMALLMDYYMRKVPLRSTTIHDLLVHGPSAANKEKRGTTARGRAGSRVTVTRVGRKPPRPKGSLSLSPP